MGVSVGVSVCVCVGVGGGGGGWVRKFPFNLGVGGGKITR